MKRQHAPRRRDRKTGISPYQKYDKTPYKYAHQSKRKEKSRDARDQ
jgi:hypothetical protein